MKNYYYILGVPNNASEQDIQAAFKKLSAKFHPDNNGGDAFFADHYKEIKEAYETLSNAQKRIGYDVSFLSPQERLSRDTAKPIIQLFDSSRTAVHDNETITLSWEVVHADYVEIEPLGRVPTRGTKTVRLPQLRHQPQLTLVIRAKNSYIQQNTEKKLSIKNKSYSAQDAVLQPITTSTQQYSTKKEQAEETEMQVKRFIERPEEFEEEEDNEDKTNDAIKTNYQQHRKILEANAQSMEKANQRNDIYVYFIVTILLIFIGVLGYLVYKMNSGF